VCCFVFLNVCVSSFVAVVCGCMNDCMRLSYSLFLLLLCLLLVSFMYETVFVRVVYIKCDHFIAFM
jgi:hypothetical protein